MQNDTINFILLVLDVFHNVAGSYDLMNDAMSLGIHRIWKDQFVSMLSPHRAMKVLDVAGGTGMPLHVYLRLQCCMKLSKRRQINGKQSTKSMFLCNFCR